jgi:hypothetical protein
MIAALSVALDENKVRPGWIAFFIVLGLCVATVLLWRSMNHQLSKISVKHADEFEEPPDDDDLSSDDSMEDDEGDDGKSAR